MARRRLPGPVFDYVDRGADAERTVHANSEAFDALLLRTEVPCRPVETTLGVDVLGREWALPVGLAPVGFLRLVHPDAELAAARAANAAGIPIVVSSLSSAPLAAVCSIATNVWFQLYFGAGLEAAEHGIDLAESAGCAALVLTMDVAAATGADRSASAAWIPSRVGLDAARAYGRHVLVRPRWLAGFVRGGAALTVPNYRTSGRSSALSTAQAAALVGAHSPSWVDVEFARGRWRRPLVVKGVLTPCDAKRAVDLGADAVVVSNHGGRALDGVPASIDALPDVVASIGDRVPVLLDGGVRRGSDVVRARALGATAVLIGRPYVWGLAAGGADGVGEVIEVLRRGTHRTLMAIGCSSIGDVDGDHLSFANEGAAAPSRTRRR